MQTLDHRHESLRASVQAAALGSFAVLILAHVVAGSRKRHSKHRFDSHTREASALESHRRHFPHQIAAVFATGGCFISSTALLISTERWQWPVLSTCCALWALSLTLNIASMLQRKPQSILQNCARAAGLSVLLVVIVPEVVIPAILSDTERGKAAITPWQAIHSGFTFLAAILLPLITPPVFADDPTNNEKQQHYVRDTASPMTRWLTYGWISPFVMASYRSRARNICAQDLPPLDPVCAPDTWQSAFIAATYAKRSTAMALWVLFRARLAVMAILMVVCGNFELLGTVGLRGLLEYLEGKPAVFQPFFLVLLFGLAPVVRGLFMQTFEYFSTQNICCLKATIIYAIHNRLLHRRPGRDIDSAGIITHITADIDKIATLRYTIMACFMVPVEVAIASVIMYRAVGYAYIPGLAVILATRIPMSWLISHYQGAAQARIMAAIDARVRRVGEVVQSLQTVKMMGQTEAITAWIGEKRTAELRSIWHKLTIVIVSDAVSSALVLAPLVVTLGLYTLGDNGQTLTPSVAFTVAAVFKTLREMLSLGVVGVSTFAQAKTSLDRVVKFLDEDLDTLVAENTDSEEHLLVGDEFLGATDAIVGRYNHNSSLTPVLDNVNLRLAIGGLNIITGKTGSGKSTLLKALLTEQPLLSGSVRIRWRNDEAVSYAGQTPWLHSGTIRDNIVFHSHYIEQRYLAALHAVGLDVDFATTLPLGDETSVSEGGGTLSGGQRFRVAIARAVYADTKTVLLDNILSALDANTARWIVQQCILGPLLSGRTVVLVTENEVCRTHARLIVELSNGKIIKMTAKDTNGSTGDVPIPHSPLPDMSTQTQNMDMPLLSSAPIAPTKPPKSTPDAEHIMDGIGGRFSILTLLRRYGSFGYVAALCTSILAMHAADVASSFLLALWSSSSTSSTASPSHFVDASCEQYLGMFTGLGLFQLLFLSMSAILFFRGSLVASRSEHAAMLASVLGATFAWTTATPMGQIMNRFSADMFALDNTVTELLRQVVDNSLAILFRVAAVSSVLPSFFVPAIVLLGLGLMTGQVYMYGSTAAKQLYSASLSPLLSGVSEAIAGIEVIRAHRKQEAVRGRFKEALVQYLQMWQDVSACQRWLAVRMDALVGLISLSTATLALVGSDSPATAGFSMTSTTTLCTALLYAVYLSSLLEVDMTSFRRLEQYIESVPQEVHVLAEPYLDSSYRNWPSHGNLEIRQMSAAYALDANPVNAGIDLSVSPGQRVAIVGRSGSGKSSLVAAVMRLIPRLAGTICIDGIDVESIDTGRLRQAVCFIPQHPVLFEGSLRFNLDLTGRIPDDVLCAVLSDVMGDAMAERGLWTLDKHIEARGANLSQGEQQLVTISRALLSKARLVIIDEATASLDKVSEERIQELLRDRMSDRALIAIAHRLETIVDFNVVLVMDAGRIVERGNPRELLESGQGRFAELWQAQSTL